jgi:hypothetical protein
VLFAVPDKHRAILGNFVQQLFPFHASLRHRARHHA